MTPWEALASVLTTLATVGSLAYWLGRKFSQIDYRFQRIDEKFDEVYKKFEEMREEMNLRFDRLHRALVSLNQSTHMTLVDFMTLKGVFTREEREFLVREVERLGRAHSIANPLKPEEARFILEVMREIREKDPRDVDLSKLDKILEIADRLLMEEGSREAAELWFKTYMLKAILRKERGEY